MNRHKLDRGAGPAIARVVLLAALLTMAAGVVFADPGWESRSRGGRSGGDGRAWQGGTYQRYKDNHRGSWGGGGYVGGGSRGGYNGGSWGGSTGGSWCDRGGAVVRYRAPRTYYGGGYPVSGNCYGGVRYYRPVYRPYYYSRPRTVFQIGLRFGSSYCPRPTRTYVDYDVERAPVYTEPDRVGVSDDFDVTNEPPAGCYYYDPFCEQQFSNLDDYTAHLDSHDHGQTVEIIERDSRRTLHTLEFVNGEWQVQQ